MRGTSQSARDHKFRGERANNKKKELELFANKPQEFGLSVIVSHCDEIETLYVQLKEQGTQ